LLKDYGMSVLYHPSKASVLANALSWLSMGSVTNVVDDKKELVPDVPRLARSDVKAMQGLDLILVELKEAMLKKSIEVFPQGENGVLRYQGRLCIPNVDDLWEKILSEADSSRYSIHPGATKLYRDLQEVYLWNGMKKGIVEFVA
ncbi:hypothetical protein MTR67_039246, partial [Solanum verrucosum]